MSPVQQRSRRRTEARCLGAIDATAKEFPDVMRDRHDEIVAMPAVRALASIMLGGGDADALLQRACEAVKAVIPPADEVSVTILDSPPRTVAASGELARQADEIQYAAGQGPCLEAAQDGRPVLVPDLTSDDRWPTYGPRAVEVGVRGSVSAPLEVDGRAAGALNIYFRQTSAFGPDVVDVAHDLAQYIAVVAATTDERQRAVTLAAQMEQAMESRAVIEQAKGILMAQRRCSADDAFEALVRWSQETHRKLREVAQALVEQVARG